MLTLLQVSVFNPHGWSVDEPVTFPVSSPSLVVRTSANAILPSTVLPADAARTNQIVHNRDSPSLPPFALHFTASLPAFGFAFFTVRSADAAAAPGQIETPHHAAGAEPLVVGNEYISLSFSRETNSLSSVTDVRRNVTLTCSQQLLYYEAEGHLLLDFKHKRCRLFVLNLRESRSFFVRSSGAYVFLPRNNSPLAFEGIPSLVVAGAAVSATPHSLPLFPSIAASFPFNRCLFSLQSLPLFPSQTAHRRRVSRWSAGSAPAVFALGGHHLSPVPRSGTR